MSRLTNWAMIALLLLVVLLTLPKLNDSIWTDEQRTLWYSGAIPHYGPISPAESIARVADNLWQAPLYYELMYGWGRLVGWDALPLRVLSLFAGVLTVAFVYRLGGVWFSREVGFYAAFTLGVGAFFINYMHDMRVYALIPLLTVIMGWAYWSALHGVGRHVLRVYGIYLILIISAAALLYSHYFASFAVASLGFYHLVFRFRHRRFWSILGCFVLAGLLFTPWMPVLLAGAGRSTHDARLVDNMSPPEMLNNILMLFSNGAQALSLLLIVLAFRVRDEAGKFVLFWLFAAAALMVIVSRFLPALTAVRYILFMFPLLALVIGIGIARFRQIGVHPALVLLIWFGFALWWLTDPAQQEKIHSADWHIPLKEMAAVIEGRTRSQDVILFHLDEGTDEAYEKNVIDYYTHGWSKEDALLISANYATSDAFYAQQVREAIKEADRIWLSYQNDRRTWRVGPVMETQLPEAGYANCGVVTETKKIHVSMFATEPKREPLTFSVADVDGGKVRVYVWNPPDVRDNVLHSMVGWRVDSTVFPGLYSLAIQVENANGEVVMSTDIGMPDHAFGCYVMSLPVDTFPDGEYTVRLSAYNWQSGEILASDDVDDGLRPVLGSIYLAD